jgi:hypothetical protein
MTCVSSSKSRSPPTHDQDKRRTAAGSPIEAIARDAAVTVSIALQFGAGLETIRQALTKDHDGGPATLLGAALDKLDGGALSLREGRRCMAADIIEAGP